MKIGVIGGGQLGRMLALAGTPLGMNFAFLDPAPDACAASLGEHIRADYGDQEHLRQLADEVDLVTFEFESVPAETVAFLSQFVPVYPNAESLRIARDRWFEKSMFKDLGIPTPDFADVQSQADLDAAAAAIGLPAVLKTRTLGYDGKGQKVLRQPADVQGAFAELGSVPCILEGFVPFTGKSRWWRCALAMARRVSTRWCTTPTTAASSSSPWPAAGIRCRRWPRTTSAACWPGSTTSACWPSSSSRWTAA